MPISEQEKIYLESFTLRATRSDREPVNSRSPRPAQTCSAKIAQAYPAKNKGTKVLRVSEQSDTHQQIGQSSPEQT